MSNFWRKNIALQLHTALKIRSAPTSQVCVFFIMIHLCKGFWQWQTLYWPQNWLGNPWQVQVLEKKYCTQVAHCTEDQICTNFPGMWFFHHDSLCKCFWQWKTLFWPQTWLGTPWQVQVLEKKYCTQIAHCTERQICTHFPGMWFFHQDSFCVNGLDSKRPSIDPKLD